MSTKLVHTGIINNEKKMQCEMQSCDSLSLTNNYLTNIPSFIGTLTHLKTLKINKNELTTVPNELYSLTNLEILDLSENKITRVEPGIRSLKNLKYLNLSFNMLIELPQETKNLKNLRFLYLNSNKLISIPNRLALLEDLVTLDIRENSIEWIDRNDNLGRTSLDIVFGKKVLITPIFQPQVVTFQQTFISHIAARVFVTLIVFLFFTIVLVIQELRRSSYEYKK